MVVSIFIYVSLILKSNKLLYIIEFYDFLCYLISYIVALKFGNILLISSTSCITIVFTAFLSPIILKEIFICKIDGFTSIMIVIGSILAVS